MLLLVIMSDEVKVEDNRGWFKKVTDAVNPAYYIAEAVNPRETQASARAKVAGDDPKKANEFNEEHYKFAKSADLELSHNGSFAKGVAGGFVNGLTGANFAGDPDFRKFHRDVATIAQHGGNHAEYTQFRQAAGDPTIMVSDGAEKQKTKVTVHDYADFCETASKALPEQRDDISRFAVKNLKQGHNLEAVTDAVEAGFEGNTNKETSLNEKAAEQLKHNQTQGNMDNALAQAENVKINATLASDNTILGVSQGNPNIGYGTQPAQSNGVVLS